LIVDNEDEAVAAVQAAIALNRGQVRAAFEQRFSSRVMASAYLDLYYRLPGFRTRYPQHGYPKAA
jgi:hypothetical protein